MNTSITFEQAVRNYLTRNNIPFEDHTDGGGTPDFVLTGASGPFWLEVKEKRQRTNTSAWPTNLPEERIFILDELTVRRLLGNFPYSAVLVRDNVHERYAFFGILDLVMMPKVRVDRRISEDHPERVKGKWILDFQNGAAGPGLNFSKVLNDYCACVDKVNVLTGAWGRYADEVIPLGGEVRTRAQKTYDFEHTR